MFDNLQKAGRRIKTEAAYYRALLADPRTPKSAKFFIGAAIAYLCMPFDLIPDWIPLLGQLDDILIVPALIWLGVRLIPEEIKKEVRDRIESQQTGNS
jgi:uncharacterized membrane protein YkvA (DUF1232 family)